MSETRTEYPIPAGEWMQRTHRWQTFRLPWWRRLWHNIDCVGGYYSLGHYSEPMQEIACNVCGLVLEVRIDASVTVRSQAWCERNLLQGWSP